MGRLATDTGDPNPLTKSRPMLGLAIARTVLQRLPTWPFPVLFWASDHHAHGRYLRIGWWNGGLALGEFRPTESFQLNLWDWKRLNPVFVQPSPTKIQHHQSSSNVSQMQVKSKSNTNSNQRGIREPPKSSEMFETKCLRLWDIERVTRDVQRSQRVNQNSSQPSTSSRSKSRENLSSVASSSTKQARTDWSNDQWETANRKIVTSQLRKTDNQLRFSWAN